MRIIVRGNPTPKQSVKMHKNKYGDLRTHPNPEHKQYHANVVGQVVNQLPNDFKLIEGPIRIDYLEFRFPYLKGFNQEQMDIVNGNEYDIGKIGRPDMDNLLKAVWDAFNTYVWRDDSRVVEMFNVRKVYGQPRFIIIFEEIKLLTGKYPLLPKWKPEKEIPDTFPAVYQGEFAKQDLFGGNQ